MTDLDFTCLLVLQEVLSRSALETQKLELLTSLSEMKLRQASLEHENLSLRNTSPLSNVSIYFNNYYNIKFYVIILYIMRCCDNIY